MASATETQTAQAVTVADRRTGEVLDLATAGTDRLAAVMTQIADLRSELGEAERAVSAELVARLDRDACWTARVGDPADDVQYEVTSPSPDAGTTVYDDAALEEALTGLVEAGTVSVAAAGQALKRTVTVIFEVPFGESALVLADRARADYRSPKVETARRTVKAGIAKLGKVPGVADALAGARREVAPPERRAKVTVKTRARS